MNHETITYKTPYEYTDIINPASTGANIPTMFWIDNKIETDFE